MERLYSLCRLADGVHWMLIATNGSIIATSHCGFATREEALKDLGVRKRD